MFDICVVIEEEKRSREGGGNHGICVNDEGRVDGSESGIILGTWYFINFACVDAPKVLKMRARRC